LKDFVKEVVTEIKNLKDMYDHKSKISKNNENELLSSIKKLEKENEEIKLFLLRENKLNTVNTESKIIKMKNMNETMLDFLRDKIDIKNIDSLRDNFEKCNIEGFKSELEKISIKKVNKNDDIETKIKKLENRLNQICKGNLTERNAKSRNFHNFKK
jgi:hypothetical protein